LPLRRTQWNLGKSFVCEGCGARLVIDKNYWLPLAAIIAFYAARQRFGDGLHLIYLLLGILAVVFIVQIQTMKPKVVESQAD